MMKQSGYDRHTCPGTLPEIQTVQIIKTGMYNLTLSLITIMT